MLGDLILVIGLWFKQNFCLHKYKTIHRKDYGGGSFECCDKCEKIK